MVKEKLEEAHNSQKDKNFPSLAWDSFLVFTSLFCKIPHNTFLQKCRVAKKLQSTKNLML